MRPRGWSLLTLTLTLARDAGLLIVLLLVPLPLLLLTLALARDAGLLIVPLILILLVPLILIMLLALTLARIRLRSRGRRGRRCTTSNRDQFESQPLRTPVVRRVSERVVDLERQLERPHQKICSNVL